MAPVRTTGSISSQIAKAWADCRYANRRLVELQLNPVQRQRLFELGLTAAQRHSR